jgi:hypothetical protein
MPVLKMPVNAAITANYLWINYALNYVNWAV